MKEKSFLLSVPSKTFLLGEYGVLWKGPAILMNTWPRFGLYLSLCSQTNSFSLEGIPKGSPVLQLLKKGNQDSIPSDGLQGFFYHPHKGQGGWGASSAEFALLSAALTCIKDESFLNLSSLLQDYKNIFHFSQSQEEEEAPTPSGADFLSQLQGGIVFCHPENKKLFSMPWPFHQADLALISTGKSFPTHKHLASLQVPPTKTVYAMHELVFLALRALQEENLDVFTKSIGDYGELLKDSGWLLDNTQNALKELQSLPGVLAVKGCGAMGAEILLAIFLKEKASVLLPALHQRGFSVMARTQDICTQGLLPVLDLKWSAVKESAVK